METVAVYIGNHSTPIEQHLLLGRWEWDGTLSFPPPELVLSANPDGLENLQKSGF